MCDSIDTQHLRQDWGALWQRGVVSINTQTGVYKSGNDDDDDDDDDGN